MIDANRLSSFLSGKYSFGVYAYQRLADEASAAAPQGMISALAIIIYLFIIMGSIIVISPLLERSKRTINFDEDAGD